MAQRKFIPILFSTPMVQAKKAGRKFQTRRVVKINNHEDVDLFVRIVGDERFYVEWESMDNDKIKCPYGKVGDVLWTRETIVEGTLMKDGYYQYDEVGNYIWRVWYKADNDLDCWYDGSSDYPTENIPWKPSIHMPKSAARFFDEIFSIRAERIASISEEDAIAEGIKIDRNNLQCWDYQLNQYRNITPVESFKTLWQSINGIPSAVQKKINGKLQTVGYTVYPFDDEAATEFDGKETWKGKPLTVISNPWVWVIEFEPIEKPADFI